MWDPWCVNPLHERVSRVWLLQASSLFLRSLLSKLESERLELGVATTRRAAAVEMIKTAIMISKLKASLTFGMPNTVASVFGTEMTNVIQVRASMTHVRPVRR